MDLVERFGELGFRDGNAVQLDALGGADQMRRRVEAGAYACHAQTAFDHGAGRPFTVGAGYVDKLRAPMRIPERFEQRADGFETELRGLQFIAERVEEPD